MFEVRRQRTLAVAWFLIVAVGGQFLASNLAKLLVEQYEVTQETALEDTLSLLEELSKRKLLLPAEGAAAR